MVRRKNDDDDLEPLPPPATTLEGRENQLIAAAMDLVEKRIRSGSASAQETVHFLRLGSVRNQLEQDKLRGENEVLKTRVKEMEGRKSQEELLSKALAAFRGYKIPDGDDPEEMEMFDDPDLY